MKNQYENQILFVHLELRQCVAAGAAGCGRAAGSYRRGVGDAGCAAEAGAETPQRQSAAEYEKKIIS